MLTHTVFTYQTNVGYICTFCVLLLFLFVNYYLNFITEDFPVFL